MAGARIFISYRRGADSDAAARLYDRLEAEFGKDAIFFDVDSIPKGVDFKAFLDRHVAGCDILLAVIGAGWVRDVERLKNEDDFVRIEIESALKRDQLPLIPVFVGGANMPDRDEMPASMAPLTRRNGVALSHENHAALVRAEIFPPVKAALAAADERRFEAEELERLKDENKDLRSKAEAAEARAIAAESEAAAAVGERDAARVDAGRLVQLDAELVKAKADLAAAEEAAREAEETIAALRPKEAEAAALAEELADTRDQANTARQKVTALEGELERLRPEAARAADLQKKLDAAVEEAKAKPRRAWAPAFGVAVVSIGMILILLFGLGPKKIPEPEVVSLAPPETTALKTGDFLDKDCAACPHMIYLGGGTFTMGSPEDEEERDNDEGPQREVTIAAFAMAETEVTFDHWAACVAGGGCKSNPDPVDRGWGRGSRPVIRVSWTEAQEYIAWLNAQVDGADPYRLPSEAEWEYAARAGTTTPFAFGETISTDQANYEGAFVYGSGAKGVYRVQTVPVEELDAVNAWGLRHMHGNVWEWVQDCWHPSYDGAPEDERAWMDGESADCSLAVLRGGSWVDDPGNLRSAYRDGNLRVIRSNHIGFRVARTLTP